MYAISDLFETYLDKRSREWLVKVNIAGTDYDSSVIVDFEIENSLALNDEFEIGTAILSKLTLRLKTIDVIAANAKVIPYVALTLPASLDGANVAWQDATDTWDEADYPWRGATTEWLQLGEFYIDNRERINNIWIYTCYDKLVQADVPYISSLTYPATQQDVWDEIMTSLGFTDDSSVVIDPTYMIQVGPAVYSKRQVMGYIASANSASVYISKDGFVRFRKFAATDTSVFDMSQSKYIRAKRTNPEKTFTKVSVMYDTDNQLSYTAGTGDENATLYITNPFATQAIVDDLLTTLNGFSYTPVEIDARGYPQIEAGDRLDFGVFVGTPTWATADVAWEDADYSWTGYESGAQTIALHTVYSFRGGLKMSVEAQSKSEQQSEFKVDGTLTTAVNDIRKNAVRTDKTYFGVSITDDDGIIVERSDHASELTINSDVLLDWRVGDVRKLYYDEIDDALKFSGTLEAADGVFSGELSAATGTFVGELQAATGTFAGELSAATGTFGGALSAATGTFAGDLSAAGGTFSGDLSAVGGTFAGELVAASGSFSGEITAQSGTIGGWTIESDRLSGAGLIEGGEIIGPEISTGASGTYPRIDLSSTGKLLYAYASILKYLQITPDFGGDPALQFFDLGADGLMGTISSLLEVFTLISPFGVDMDVGAGGDLSLSAGVGHNVYFDSFSDVVNASNSQSLQSAINQKADGSGVGGTVYVATTSGGAATTPITFFDGVRFS